MQEATTARLTNSQGNGAAGKLAQAARGASSSSPSGSPALIVMSHIS